MTVKSGASKDARTYNETWMTSGSFSMLTSSKVYIGGSKEPFRLPGSSSKNNFVGCLRNVSIPPFPFILGQLFLLGQLFYNELYVNCLYIL